MASPRRRRFIVPEVVQTSAMDCGPAVLKCVLEGYGIPVHYGRLREACQTDVDGTSVNVLEEVAGQLGLEAEQVMLPLDHLLLHEAEALPAIVVVSLQTGVTHFVLVWRRHGRFVQVMDPGVGRRWLSGERFLEEVYVHSQTIEADQWRAWAVSDDFRRPLVRRLCNLGAGQVAETLIATAAGGGTACQSVPLPLARLDAATRLVESLVHSGGLRRGREARNLLTVLLEKSDATLGIPEGYWFARPAPPGPDGKEQISIRGAVLVRVRGRKQAGEAPPQLSPELAAAVAEPASRPVGQLFGFLGTSPLALVFLVAGLALAAGGLVLEAVLLRGVLEVGRSLNLVEQRLQAIGVFLLFAGALAFLELRLANALARLGRRLEGRLRLAFLQKIPRLNDRYFHSRPISDMAERSHTLQQVRLLPRLVGQFVRAGFALLVTAAAIAWIDPASAAFAGAAAVLALGLPLAATPLLQELDLRVRNHTGALSRFYLDALQGLAAVRAHAAERALRREQETLLMDWAQASRRRLGWVVLIEGVQIAVGFGLASWLLLLHTSRVTDTGAAMLLAYWALNLPVLGEEIVLLLRQYPSHRSVTLRLLEPLGAPEDAQHATSSPDSVSQHAVEKAAAGIAITLENVTVHAAGQTILRDVDLRIDAGSQIAVVGGSGAGKSTLVGLLLGWHRAAAGRVLIDGEPLDGERLDRLRSETAWVEPAVHLWNRSLLENLEYGGAAGRAEGPEPPESSLGAVLDAADLHGVLQRLPHGLQTPLGEGGGLVSGGEGQRVRFGRALRRGRPRLVILDEPFRGLDREKRRALLMRARQHWQGATLVCITHDVGETRGFERVLVIEGGRIVEDGSPDTLAAETGSRYRTLLDAEEAVRTGLWSSVLWQRLRLEAGQVVVGKAGGEK